MLDSNKDIIVVITQPMYFPWIGMLVQIRASSRLVYYNDVQFSRGFVNRVQIKTEQGSSYMTIPLAKHPQSVKIDALESSELIDWRSKHRAQFLTAYRRAPHLDDAISLLDNVHAFPSESVAEISQYSMDQLGKYFGILPNTPPVLSSSLGIGGHGSQRILDIVRACEGKIYLTGHGARNYLSHEAFEDVGIDVKYVDYQIPKYRQLHGAFTPYVSSLDLVANHGTEGLEYIESPLAGWKQFIS